MMTNVIEAVKPNASLPWRSLLNFLTNSIRLGTLHLLCLVLAGKSIANAL